MNSQDHSTTIQWDDVSFEQFFRMHYRRMSVFASRLLKDTILAEDLVQDAFIKLYEKRDKLTIKTTLEGYLLQMIRNSCIDYLRKNKVDLEDLDGVTVIDASTASSILIQLEYEEAFYEVVKSLPDQCRKIFELSRFEGKTNSEIAETLNISKRTVESQISNALKRLKKEFLPLIKSLIIIWL